MSKRSVLSDRGQTVAEILALGVVRRLRRRARGGVGLLERSGEPEPPVSVGRAAPVDAEVLLVATP